MTESDNGLSTVRRIAITWSNDDLLSTVPFKTTNWKLFIDENVHQSVFCKRVAIFLGLNGLTFVRFRCGSILFEFTLVLRQFLWKQRVVIVSTLSSTAVVMTRTFHVTRSPVSKKYASYQLMMTSSNGNIFLVTGPLWGKSTCDRWTPPPSQKPVTRSIDVFFDLLLKKRLSK